LAPLLAFGRRHGETVAFAALVIVLLGSWIWRAYTWYAFSGLFVTLGGDFGYYYSLVHTLWSRDPNDLYDVASLNAVHQQLQPWATLPVPLGEVPYPPLFAWLLSPLASVSPPVGFALWSLLNAGASVYLGWRVSTLFSQRLRRWVWLGVSASLPVGYSLLLGQPMALLACTTAEFYISARAGRDARAGLWLAWLFVKPNYLLLLVPLLVWKKRWRILFGLSIGGAIVVLGSMLVAGLPSLIQYPSAVLTEGSLFRGGATYEYPLNMINWRTLVIRIPWLDNDVVGITLTVLLSSLSVVAAAWVWWRGGWEASSNKFAPRLLMVLIATLLASYHSHLPGLVFLAMPLAAIVARFPLAFGLPLGIWLFGTAVLFTFGGIIWHSATALGLIGISVGLFVWSYRENAMMIRRGLTTFLMVEPQSPASLPKNSARAGSKSLVEIPRRYSIGRSGK
jgi:hypothetical protein